MLHQALIDSLVSELNKPKKLSGKEISWLLANTLFSCTLSGFSIFLSKQQTILLCEENFNCSSAEAKAFFVPNGATNLIIVIFTSAQLFSAIQRAMQGKNNAFYIEKKNNKKIPIRLSLSILTGLLAAIPLMLNTKDPVESKLVFIANFIMASYTFFSLAQDLSISSSYLKPNVQKFLQVLKAYELNGAAIPHPAISRWIKISSSILLPLFYNGPFCMANILLLNNPDNDIGALDYFLPENKSDRLVASVFLGTTLTMPWLILAGLFGYHLPDTLIDQFYQNPFARHNPKLNASVQIVQSLISLCSFAVPLKFYLDVNEELFGSCDEFCTFLGVFVAISGVLFAVIPNFKIAELFIIIWNLFLSNNVKNREETFSILNAREMAAQFKDMQMILPADEVDNISKELETRVSTMTERTSLLQYPQQQSQNQASEDNALTSVSHNNLKLIFND